ncbi:putative transcription factor & chromatin remodeling ARID family [Helianthus annuus]|nr:putative transcription factor & chromatin remodeling ARID family [Helianthus annuus]
MMVGVTPFPAECNRHITVSHNVYNKLAGNHCRALRQFHFLLNCPKLFLLLVPIFPLCFVCNYNTMKTNSSNTGNASADVKPDVQHSGIRATVGNRRKLVDIIRFRAQPDDEQNREYGDERRRRLRVEQDVVPTMNYVCKNRESDDGIDKDSKKLKYGQISVPSFSHERVEDGYGMGRSIHEDGEQFKRCSDDEEDVSMLNPASTDVHDGACFTPNIYMVGYDREDQEEPISDQKDHNDSIEQTEYYDSGGDCNDEEDEDSYVFVTESDMQDNVPVTGTVHKDKNIKKRKSGKGKEGILYPNKVCSIKEMIIFLDSLKAVKLAITNEDEIKMKFMKMVKWFTRAVMKQSSTFPPKLQSKDVDLYDLYMVVLLNGGKPEVSRKQYWPRIATTLGLNPTKFIHLVLLYNEYLDFMGCYYTRMKRNSSGQCNNERGQITTSPTQNMELEESERRIVINEDPVHEAQTVDDANKSVLKTL